MGQWAKWTVMSRRSQALCQFSEPVQKVAAAEDHTPFKLAGPQTCDFLPDFSSAVLVNNAMAQVGRGGGVLSQSKRPHWLHIKGSETFPLFT